MYRDVVSGVLLLHAAAGLPLPEWAGERVMGLEGSRSSALLARLADEGLPLKDRQDVWAEAQRVGLLDELLAVFERRAEGAPDDAQVQADLGNACLQAVQYLQNPLKQGDLANRADAAFDRALAIDDRHWEARFQKALALSFWPAALGKKGESIRNFEMLIEQQDTMPRETHHAQTYLFLGNLYEEQGRTDDAQAMWARGLRAFPDSDDLLKRARGR